MSQSKIFYVNKVKNLINNTDKDILLVGKTGFGKTTVLNEVKNHSNNEKIIVDGSFNIGEYQLITDYRTYNLYYICVIVKKLLFYIRKNYSNKYMTFIRLNATVEDIIEQINLMNIVLDYKRMSKLVGEDLYNNPEILLDEAIYLINNVLGINELTLIIDNFDGIGQSSQMYQELIYKRVREYFKLVLTISDENVVDNKKLLEDLETNNEIVKIEYSLNPISVKEILDRELCNILNCDKKYLSKHNVLDEETVLLVIEKTQGNLYKMIQAVRGLYWQKDFLNILDYNSYILNYIDNIINIDPTISGIPILKRTLYVNPLEKN